MYEKLVGKGAVPGSLPKFLKHSLARFGQGISAFKTFVTQPEEVETDFIALEQLIVAEGVEAFAFPALVAIFDMITGYKVVKMSSRERISTQGKILVGAQVIDP